MIMLTVFHTASLCWMCCSCGTVCLSSSLAWNSTPAQEPLPTEMHHLPGLAVCQARSLSLFQMHMQKHTGTQKTWSLWPVAYAVCHLTPPPTRWIIMQAGFFNMQLFFPPRRRVWMFYILHAFLKPGNNEKQLKYSSFIFSFMDVKLYLFEHL